MVFLTLFTWFQAVFHQLYFANTMTEWTAKPNKLINYLINPSKMFLIICDWQHSNIYFANTMTEWTAKPNKLITNNINYLINPSKMFLIICDWPHSNSLFIAVWIGTMWWSATHYFQSQLQHYHFNYAVMYSDIAQTKSRALNVSRGANYITHTSITSC